MQQVLYTAEDMDRYPDYELDCGVLVPMKGGSWRHGKLCIRIGSKVNQHVEEHGLGDVLGNDCRFLLQRDPDTMRGPDVAFIRPEVSEAIQALSEDERWLGPPDLAIEVVSPGDRPGEVQRKVGQYLDSGTRMVWVIDERRDVVAVYLADGTVQVLHRGEALEGGDVLPGFRWALDDLFRP